MSNDLTRTLEEQQKIDKIEIGFTFILDESMEGIPKYVTNPDGLGWESGDVIEVVKLVNMNDEYDPLYVCLNLSPDVLNVAKLDTDFFVYLLRHKEAGKEKLLHKLRDAIQECENHGIRVFHDNYMITGAVLSTCNSETIITLIKE